jgi:hypothetical protein
VLSQSLGNKQHFLGNGNKKIGDREKDKGKRKVGLK